MELLLTCVAVAVVIVAFALADYLDAKAKALHGSRPDNAGGTE